MAGVVEGYIVWDSRCSCGLTSSVTWEIPDLSELTVDHAAKVTSVTTTKIQGKTRRYKSSTSVSKKQKASVSLNRSKLTLYVGKSSRLTAKIQGASKKAVWRSSKPSVASVTSKGLVKGKKAGTAVITAKANGENGKIYGNCQTEEQFFPKQSWQYRALRASESNHAQCREKVEANTNPGDFLRQFCLWQKNICLRIRQENLLLFFSDVFRERRC